MNYRKTFDTEDPFPDEESSWTPMDAPRVGDAAAERMKRLLKQERRASRKLVLYDENGDRITLTCVEWDDGRQVPFYQLDCGEAYLTLADIETIVDLARETSAERTRFMTIAEIIRELAQAVGNRSFFWPAYYTAWKRHGNIAREALTFIAVSVAEGERQENYASQHPESFLRGRLFCVIADGWCEQAQLDEAEERRAWVSKLEELAMLAQEIGT